MISLYILSSNMIKNDLNNISKVYLHIICSIF